MLTIEDIKPGGYLSAYISIAFAEDVLFIFENRYPKDIRPRKAIEEMKKYLRGETYNIFDIDNAANAAHDTNLIYHNTNTNFIAAKVAYAIANASYIIGCTPSNFSIGCLANSISYSADAACNIAICADNNITKEYIHQRFLKMLPFILKYKIDNKESFGNPEKVFEYLNEEEQSIVLFHLDILV
jgi:hypothetical protein